MHIRSIKPDFFRHEGLFRLEKETGFPMRIVFAGLWCAADREGRFDWKPNILKLDILPWDDCDFGKVLDCLERAGFVVRYEIGGKPYGHIPTFLTHQHVPPKEAASKIPMPTFATTRQLPGSSSAVLVEPDCNSRLEWNGMERNGMEGSEASVATSQPPTEDIFDSSDWRDLKQIPSSTRKIWIRTYGEDIVRTQLPLIYAAWTSDPLRQLQGNVEKYIRSWLQNSFEREKKTRDSPRYGPSGEVDFAKVMAKGEK